MADRQQAAFWWNADDARLVDLAMEPPTVGALQKADVPFSRAVALRRRLARNRPAPQ